MLDVPLIIYANEGLDIQTIAVQLLAPKVTA